MSLTEANPSPAVMVELFARWADFARPTDPSLNALLHVHPEENCLQVIYALGLQDLAKPDLAKARKVGWRWLASSALREAVAANLDQLGDAKPQMTGLTRGDEIASAIRAAQRVRELPPAADTQPAYELRVLKIPGLLMEVFWLKAKTGADDLVVPYFALFAPQLNVMKVLPANEFLKIVQPIAIQCLQNLRRASPGKAPGYNGPDKGKQPRV